MSKKSYILASQNSHKAQELSSILGNDFEIKPAEQALNVIENGVSFQENALLKAKAYFDKYQSPCLSDDSGLCLNEFPDILGIHSARFAPQFHDYTAKCLELLRIFAEKPDAIREAYFITIICLYVNHKEILFFEGRTKGLISESILGKEGFGYDPIFVPTAHPQQLSYAQDPSWKEQNGHRAKACQALSKFLKGTAKI